ncbi:MAG TPA: hypothetical protein VNJ08_13915 [Bacteriovoracaceae bacterium]|nr:hypothetical protein [Bacteriovoracaceae bacterium]
MKAILIQEDIKLVESRLKKFEEETGCELLLVVANAADPYPAASLRFGLISGFLISLIFSYYFEFHTALLWPVSMFLIILVMIWVGHFQWAKRLALSSWEIQRECDEKAVEFFHSLGTTKVTHKVTAMIMVATLERQLEVRVDETLKAKISQQDLDELVSVMIKHFSKGNMASGLIESISVLQQKILTSFGGRVSDTNPGELHDTIQFITV